MSFSKDVKDELSLQLSSARHCRLAELAAILSYGGHINGSGSQNFLKLQTENLVVARKYFTLIRKTFNINIDISIRTNSHLKKNSIYTLIIKDSDAVVRILQATKLSYEETPGQDKITSYDNTSCLDKIYAEEKTTSQKISPKQEKAPIQHEAIYLERTTYQEKSPYQDKTSYKELGKASDLIVQKACCKRAFIRGAFLSAGSMSNPKKAYHLEIVVSDMTKAEQLKNMIQTFSIDAKIVIRKKNYVVYIKEGSQIVDLLNVMEAHVALMNLENVRILKEMRNSINRQVNCEAANINKTVNASSKQIDDIIYIRDNVGFGDLAEGLEEIARLRIQHPEASLKELGAMLLPQIGKSGVNHRLRKLSMIADHIREHKEENSHDNEGNGN